MHNRLKIILVIILSAAWLGSTAGNYVFRQYTVDDGLASNGVRAVCQDRYGFMWFGLDNGLCRFDGVRISSYRHNRSSSDQFVSALFPGDTCLWIGSDRGLTTMRFSDERFSRFTRRTRSGVAINSTVVNITADNRRRLWIATLGQGVFCYDGRAEGTLVQYTFGGQQNAVSQVVTDAGGDVWAVMRGDGPCLYRLKRGGSRFEPFRPAGPSPLPDDISVMIAGAGNSWWFGTRSHGLVGLSADGRLRSWLHSGADRVRKIHSLLELRPGVLLVGSDDGLTSIDTRSGRTVRYTAQTGRTGALSDRFVYPLVRDREGGLWIGTFYGGVNYAAPNSGRFTAYAHSSSPHSLAGNVINRFAEDRGGTIWIASDDGGLCSLNPKSGQITRHSVCTGREGYGNVHGLLADGGDLWVGTYTGGLYRMNLRTGACRRYTAFAGNTSDATSCYALLRDSRGRLWCGSLESVSRYDAASDRFVFTRRLGAIVIDIEEDRRGRLWFATQGKGLFRYDPRTGRWIGFRTDRRQGGLRDASINCVTADARGRVIVAAVSGLYVYDEAGRRFLPFCPELRGTEPTAVVEDRGTYWITTVNGLVHYRPGHPLRRFGMSDGLQSNQYFPNAMLRASDGQIYAGTRLGFTAFNPSHIAVNKVAPAVAITGIEVMNRPLQPGSRELPLAVNHLRELHLDYGKNIVTLLFAAQSYCAPGNNRYACRLDGYDRNWNYTGSTARVTYSNLPPGTYTFRVKATNNDGVWSRHEAVLKIVVHAPFYLSMPMILLYIVVLAGAAFYLVRMLRRRRRLQTAAALPPVPAPSPDVAPSPEETASPEAAATAGQVSAEAEDEFLSRIRQIIEEHYTNPGLSVNEIAVRMSVSRSGLFSKIKSLSGMTPNDMITLVRLEHAASMLRENRYQVSEICYRVGFGNPSYFSKCFKRRYGVTPAEFMAAQSGDEA